MLFFTFILLWIQITPNCTHTSLYLIYFICNIIFVVCLSLLLLWLLIYACLFVWGLKKISICIIWCFSILWKINKQSGKKNKKNYAYRYPTARDFRYLVCLWKSVASAFNFSPGGLWLQRSARDLTPGLTPKVTGTAIKAKWLVPHFFAPKGPSLPCHRLQSVGVDFQWGPEM